MKSANRRDGGAGWLVPSASRLALRRRRQTAGSKNLPANCPGWLARQAERSDSSMPTRCRAVRVRRRATTSPAPPAARRRRVRLSTARRRLSAKSGSILDWRPSPAHRQVGLARCPCPGFLCRHLRLAVVRCRAPRLRAPLTCRSARSPYRRPSMLTPFRPSTTRCLPTTFCPMRPMSWKPRPTHRSFHSFHRRPTACPL